MSELTEYDYSITINDLDVSFFNTIVKQTNLPVVKKPVKSESISKTIVNINDDDDFYGNGEDQMVSQNPMDIIDASNITTEKTEEVIRAEQEINDMDKLKILDIKTEKTETLDSFFKNIRNTMPFMSPQERAVIIFQLVYCKMFTLLKYKDSSKAPTELSKLSTIDTIVQKINDDEPARFPNAYSIVSNYIKLCKISGPGEVPLNKFITFIGSLGKDKISATSYNLKLSLSSLTISADIAKFLNENGDKNYIKALNHNVITKFLIGNKTTKAAPIAKAKTVEKKKEEEDEDEDDYDNGIDERYSRMEDYY